jgi:hypothetical protein
MGKVRIMWGPDFDQLNGNGQAMYKSPAAQEHKGMPASDADWLKFVLIMDQRNQQHVLNAWALIWMKYAFGETCQLS